MLIPAHGPLPQDVPTTLDAAHRRVSRLVDDPAGAVWYSARRVFGFALMMYDGIALTRVEGYLRERAWVQDAAREVGRDTDEFISELITSMRASGAVKESGGRLRAAAEYDAVDRRLLEEPWPSKWPPAGSAGEQVDSAVTAKGEGP